MSSFAKLKNRYNKDDSRQIPNEILLKIFEYLNVSDLIKCSYVCKNWNNTSKSRTFWLKWSKKFKINNEFTQLINENNNGEKACFKKILIQKKDINLLKLSSQITKKINNFTKLPDLKHFHVNNTLKLNWELAFYDNKNVLINRFKSNEQNLFEASCSIIWSDLSQVKQAFKLKIFSLVPVYLNLNNGKIFNYIKENENESYMNLNETNKILIFESEFDLNNRNLLDSLIYKDSMIKLFEFKKELLIATWSSSNNNKNDLAFITFNKVFSFDFISLISNQKKVSVIKKTTINDLELDKNFGLHDYKIYFCMRNQTNTIFISLSKTVYKASLETYMNDKYVLLNVIESDFYQISMLPKFTWNTEILKKNIINLVSIIDLCIYDSNNRLIIADSFPVNIQPNNETNDFISDESFKFNFKDENYILTSKISSSNSKSTLIQLDNLDVYLSLKFVDSCFNTKFSNKQ